MRITVSLEQIHSPWLSRVSHHLARGAELRENTIQLLDRFFSMVMQAVQTGDPAWIDRILDEWVEARTQTELETRESSLTPIINGILMQTFQVVTENLEPNEALELIEALLPI